MLAGSVRKLLKSSAYAEVRVQLSKLHRRQVITVIRLKTFRTGLLLAEYGFSVQCKCFCRTCAVARAENWNINERFVCTSREFFKRFAKNSQKIKPDFFILCYIDFYRFDEKASWWYIKRRECPNIGLSPLDLVNSRHQWFKLGRLYFYSFLSFR